MTKFMKTIHWPVLQKDIFENWWKSFKKVHNMCELQTSIFKKCSQFLKFLSIKSFENYYIYTALGRDMQGDYYR